MYKLIFLCFILAGCSSVPQSSSSTTTTTQGAIKIIDEVDNVIDCISVKGHYWGLPDSLREMRAVNSNELVCFEYENEKL